MIKSLEDCLLRQNVPYSVYANYLRGDSLQDILSNFCGVLEEVINEVNTYTSIVTALKEWIETNGLQDAVNKKIDDMINKGQFDDIINQQIFGDLYSKVQNLEGSITALNSDLSNTNDNINKTNDKINNVISSINNVKYLKPLNCKYPTLSTTLTPSYNPADDTGMISVYKRQKIDCSLCVMVSVSSLTDNNIQIDSLDRIKDCVTRLKNSGINITMIKPHIGVNFRDDTYRGNLDPTNKDIFFQNWLNTLIEFAKISNELNIPQLCISVEMDKLTVDGYSSKWSNIYSSIKQRFPDLTIVNSLSTEEWNKIKDRSNSVINTDIVGINIYLSITNKPVSDLSVDVSTVTNGFTYNQWGLNTIDCITYITNTLNKPVVITETGVTATEYCLTKIEPWQATKIRRGQELYFKGFLETIPHLDGVIGFNIWHTDEPFAYFDKSSPNSIELYITKYLTGGIN